jgi:hypothetical protein
MIEYQKAVRMELGLGSINPLLSLQNGTDEKVT